MFSNIGSLILVSLQIVISVTEPTAKRIEPDKAIIGEILHDKEAVTYAAYNLLENTTYEVRVSYPAVIPTEFVIAVIHPGNKDVHQSRKLLNIEKTVFRTSKATEGFVIEVRAHRVGVPWNPERLKDPVIYNIVLETLYAGLSNESWKVVVLGVICVVVTFKYLVPILNDYIIKATEVKEKTEHIS